MKKHAGGVGGAPAGASSGQQQMEDDMAEKDVEAIAKLVEDWSRALERKDVAGLTRGYAEDVVLFDVKPPWRIDGVPGYRQVWEQCLPHLPDRLVSKRRQLAIEVSGDLAFARGLHTFEPSPTWVRFTICYRRVNGSWLVAHEHVSVPFDPRSGKVVFITDADATSPEGVGSAPSAA
jgi:ketosteroid isomerase-like protein